MMGKGLNKESGVCDVGGGRRGLSTGSKLVQEEVC